MEYRAFECQFFTVGGGFDQYKVLKVKCSGICPGRGCYTFVLIGALHPAREKKYYLKYKIIMYLNLTRQDPMSLTKFKIILF